MLSGFQTVTFVGDSLVRNTFMGLLLQTNTMPAQIKCLGHDPIPLNASGLVDCYRDNERFTGVCERPPPVCCSTQHRETAAEAGALDSVQAQFLARKYQQVHTDGLPQFCDGKLRATMVRIYVWNNRQEAQQCAYARQHLRTLARTPGRHLLVVGAGLHYMDGDAARKVSRRAFPFFRDLLTSAGLSHDRHGGGDGRFTVVVQPVHYRHPKQKYASSQSNERTKKLMEILIDDIVATFLPIQNGWSGVLGAEPPSPAGGSGSGSGSGSASASGGGNAGRRLESSFGAEGKALPPHAPRRAGGADNGHRILVLDTWRMSRWAVDNCAPGYPPYPYDGSHWHGPGDFIFGRLLLNTVAADEERRARGVVAVHNRRRRMRNLRSSNAERAHAGSQAGRRDSAI